MRKPPRTKKPRAPRRETYRRLTDPVTGQALDAWTRGKETTPTPGMPYEVRIFGQRYAVRYVTLLYAERALKHKLAGCVLYDHRVIFLDPSATLSAQRETLHHEIAHVWMHTSGIEKVLTAYQLEVLCDVIGAGVVDLQP